MSHSEHKKKINATFDTVSGGYDSPALRFFAKSSEWMISGMDLKGGENVLDVATGTGHAALAAARELKDGSVTGIDISDGMLRRAREKADKLGLRNVSFKRCDIEDMGFADGYFDAVCCAFGIFFLPDMESGLKCISKALKPRGKIYLTSFREGLMEPLRGTLLEGLKKYGVEPAPLSWMRLDTPEKIKGLLQNTSYQNIFVKSRQLGYYLGDVDEWWDVLWNSGYRELLSRLSPEDLRRFRDDHLREVNTAADGDGIWLNVQVLLAVAEK